MVFVEADFIESYMLLGALARQASDPRFLKSDIDNASNISNSNPPQITIRRGERKLTPGRRATVD
jgi:hypothetical protein